jgi:hypothetical protein
LLTSCDKEGHRPEPPGESEQSDSRAHADERVSWVADERAGAADVRRDRERDQVGRGLKVEPLRHAQEDRRQHQADRVVHEQRREDARRDNHEEQQRPRASGETEDAALYDLEKARQLQIAEHDHHAKQEQDRVQVDRAFCLVEGDDPEGDHRAGAEQRSCGSSDVQPPDPLNSDDEVGHQEDQERRCHATTSPSRCRRW